MKTFLPWLLFAVSAAFNVFFVAGRLAAPRAPAGRPGPEERTEFIARKLDLDEGQKRAFLELEKKSDEERSRIGRERAGQIDALMKEMVKDKPDEAAVGEFLKARSAENRAARFVDHIRAVMKILKPGQREKAAEWFRTHGESRKPRETGGG